MNDWNAPKALERLEPLERAHYPESPGFKEPTTSRDAAREMVERAAILRLRLIKLYARGMRLTADEAARMLDESILSVRPRVSELARLEMLVDTGERRPNASGKRARVMAWASGQMTLGI